MITPSNICFSAQGHLAVSANPLASSNRLAVTQKLRYSSNQLNNTSKPTFKPSISLCSLPPRSATSLRRFSTDAKTSKTVVPKFCSNNSTITQLPRRTHSSQSESLNDTVQWNEYFTKVEANMPLLGPILLFILFLYFQDLADRAAAEAAEQSLASKPTSGPAVSDVYKPNESANQFETLEIEFLKPKKTPKQESTLKWFWRV
jgi:hypothetical protein